MTTVQSHIQRDLDDENWLLTGASSLRRLTKPIPRRSLLVVAGES